MRFRAVLPCLALAVSAAACEDGDPSGIVGTNSASVRFVNAVTGVNGTLLLTANGTAVGSAQTFGNFSGTGYGLKYVLAAKGDVANGRVLPDIIDGLDYVLAQGIGDRKRQAIMGMSFGGYASLPHDDHVPFKSIVNYVGEARRLGKPLSLPIDPDGGHSPKSRLGLEASLYMIELAAQRHLGGALSPVAPELKVFLSRNVRVGLKVST